MPTFEGDSLGGIRSLKPDALRVVANGVYANDIGDAEGSEARAGSWQVIGAADLAGEVAQARSGGDVEGSGARAGGWRVDESADLHGELYAPEGGDVSGLLAWIDAEGADIPGAFQAHRDARRLYSSDQLYAGHHAPCAGPDCEGPIPVGQVEPGDLLIEVEPEPSACCCCGALLSRFYAEPAACSALCAYDYSLWANEWPAVPDRGEW